MRLPQRGRRERIEQKHKRVKERKACKFGRKEKKEEERTGKQDG